MASCKGNIPNSIGGLPTKLSGLVRTRRRAGGTSAFAVRGCIEFSVGLRICRRQRGDEPDEDKPGIARQGVVYYNVSVGLRCDVLDPDRRGPRLRTSIARQNQPRGQMSAIKVLAVAAITAMPCAVPAHAGHVNGPA